jgi:hypothetical protein
VRVQYPQAFQHLADAAVDDLVAAVIVIHHHRDWDR